MGLFSKKPKEPEYNEADCIAKKTRMREIFNGAVKDGSTYEILYAYMSTSKYEKGFVFDTNTTSFFYYIVGYRQQDFSLVFVQVDAALQEYAEPFYVDMDNVVNVSYTPKVQNIGSTSAKTLYGPKNIHQPEEIEAFLNFAEGFRAVLEQNGYKLDKWKR